MTGKENLTFGLLLLAGIVPVYGYAATFQAADPFASVEAKQKFITQYCAGCHNDRLKSGDMTLTKLNLADPDKSAELSEKVIRKLRAGMMPPPGMPKPGAVISKSLAASLERSVDAAAMVHPNPGRPALHRLNRTEYANSIHDLFDVDINAASLLPPDDMSHGFDNMADVLTISPALMEGYIRAAGKVSRQAVGDSLASPLMVTFQVPRVVSQVQHVTGAPFGTRGGISVVHHFPADGDYIFKVTFYYSLDGPLFGLSQGKGQQIEISVNGQRAALLDIDPMIKKWDELKTPPIKVKAGPQRISAAFIEKAEGPVEDSIQRVGLSLIDLNQAALPGLTSLAHLHELSISGPTHIVGVSDTPSRRKIFVCRPSSEKEELPCAKKILAPLARQAYRRPVTQDDLNSLLEFYAAGRKDGSFDSGITDAIQALIASPEFVFRFERNPAGLAPGTTYAVTDLELASRLSYFLWSTSPDDELIRLANRNKLRKPKVLQKQVKRMLADQRANALATNFAAEWLHLQNLKGAQPDAYLYPNFERTLGLSMRRETEMFFESIMRENRSVLDLLNADYTFVDERLARHYGIPNVLGDRFRRVQISDDNRKGLLGEASILTLTSASNRTSPVARGKYVMEVFLGTPPPPPPPNVPALKENAEGFQPISVRQRMEEHRKNPACASCHKLMDPIGFSLENFNAVGGWRTNDSGFQVDAVGQMYDGAKLDGPASLRKALLQHSDAFIGTFTENLLAYGMGRVLQTSDMPAVRSIEMQAATQNDQFSAFIWGVVNSAPFRMRTAEGVRAPTTSIAQNEERTGNDSEREFNRH